MRVFVYTLLIFAAVYALLGPFDWEGRSREIVDVDKLALKFEKTIFASEFGDVHPVVERWDGDVVIGISGDESEHYLPYVRDIAATLCRLTGHGVRAIDLGKAFDVQVILRAPSFPKPPQPNFFVFLAQHRDLGRAMSFIPGAEEQIKSKGATGFGTGGGIANAIEVAFVGVAYDGPAAKVRNTLLEEITQGFGPINDTEIVQPSIWSDGGPDIDYLPLNDQIILRALYDPAIRPGMPKDEAMEVARTVIPQLVEAARREGERALHQRDDCGRLER